MTVPHGGEPAPSEATKRTSRFRLRAHLRTLAMNCRPFMFATV